MFDQGFQKMNNSSKQTGRKEKKQTGRKEKKNLSHEMWIMNCKQLQFSMNHVCKVENQLTINQDPESRKKHFIYYAQV